MIGNLIGGLIRIILAVWMIPLTLIYGRVMYEGWGRVSTAAQIVSNPQTYCLVLLGFVFLLAWGIIVKGFAQITK